MNISFLKLHLKLREIAAHRIKTRIQMEFSRGNPEDTACGGLIIQWFQDWGFLVSTIMLYCMWATS